MKHFSEYLKFDGFLIALKRDWGSFLFAMLAFGFSIVATGQDLWKMGYGWQTNFFCLTMSLALGIPLTLGARIIFPRPLYAMLTGLLLPFLFFLGMWWVSLSGQHSAISVLSFFVLTHLFVAIAPQLARQKKFAESDVSVWNFNWFLFQRFLVASITASILSIAGSIALWSLKSLFSISFPSEWYAWLTLTCFFPIQTSMVLMSLNSYKDQPLHGSHRPDESTTLLITQWLFAPIIAIYFIILYVYMAKILISGIWPKGQVGGLVSGLTAVIFTAFILQSPARVTKEKILSAIERWSFPLLIPCLLILIVALLKRISVYGWTPSRYTVFMLALWAIGLSVWFLRPQGRHKLLVPLSLFFLTLLTWVGPLSPYSVGLRSQTATMKAKLAKLDFVWNAAGQVPRFEIKSTKQQRLDVGLSYDSVLGFCSNYGVNNTLAAFSAPDDLFLFQNKNVIERFIDPEVRENCFNTPFEGRSVLALLGVTDDVHDNYVAEPKVDGSNEASQNLLTWHSRVFQVNGDTYAWIGPGLPFNDAGSNMAIVENYQVSIDYSFKLSIKKMSDKMITQFELKDFFTQENRKHVFDFDHRRFEIIMIQGTYDPKAVVQRHASNVLLILKKAK